MKKFFATTIFAFAITGCANVTDVVSTGPGTYMIAAEGVLGNSSSGKQAFKATEQAAAFCSTQSKQVNTIEVKVS